MTNNLHEKIAAALFGLATGDALGVPVEFLSREKIADHPITDMVGYGTYHQPAGTWSDDSSMTFCLADSLCRGYNIEDMAKAFLGWYRRNEWTPHGAVFDIGISTKEALIRIENGTTPLLAGGSHVSSNGNGSLMRILPLVFYTHDSTEDERWQMVSEVSSITHRHIRSIAACYYYLEFARSLLQGLAPQEAYQQLQPKVLAMFQRQQVDASEIRLFDGLLKNNIADQPIQSIESSGYVLHTLEASIWCLLTTDNYSASVLKAVNLGLDTDTTGAVTGGLAGLWYGLGAIPESWKEQLARKAEIDGLAERLADAILERSR